MRVVQINGGAKGSTGKIMMGIAEVARAQGHEVMCASPITTTNRDAGEDCGYYRIGTFNSRRVNVALARITGFNGCFAWFETYKLLKKIDEFKPDIIHLHNLHDSYINLPMLFSYIKKHNVPTVWTLHDCWAFTGQCPHFTMVKCDKWKAGCYGCPQYKEYPASLYDNTKKMWQLKKKWFTGVKNMTIVTPSEWLAGLARESYLKQYPIEVINNGIDLNVFKPTHSNFRKQYGIPGDKYIVLGVSFAWGYRKGLDCFVEMAEKLGEQYQIVLVGTDDEIDKNLPHNIISIHRTQNQKELAEIYSAADVFVMPTREENYPTVNMEAIACGTPVVTFDTGGSPEMLDDKTGIVVEANDIEATKKAIKDICEKKRCNDEEYIVAYSKNFDMKKRFAEYIELYANVLEE
jgi:putative colanic acid biosynthesis glycosyltransferase